MGKRLPRSPTYRRKNHAGCMSVFMSLFDFRSGRSTPKLISDRWHGSGRHTFGSGYSRNRLKLLNDVDRKSEGKNDGDENRTSKIDIGRRSVKKLMEEEMFSEQQPKKKIRTASLDSQDPQYSNHDLVAMMEEFCTHVQQRLHHESKGDSSNGQESITSISHNQLDELDLQLVQKHTILEEKLSEAAEAFLNQKFVDSKDGTDGVTNQSKQFMDALDILNSNKELLLKLLEDSNSLLVKHIQDLRDSQSEEVDPMKSSAIAKLSEADIVHSAQEPQDLVFPKQVQKQNMYKLFWRKMKSQSKNPSKVSDGPLAPNRIVVLKPNPVGIPKSSAATSPRSPTRFHKSLRHQGEVEKLNSKFSLKEIKEKLMRVIGESRKEQDRIEMGALLHKVPSECKDDKKGITLEITGEELIRNLRARRQKAAKSAHRPPENGHEGTSVRGDEFKNVTPEVGDYPKERESNIYIEAKKHLSDMLTIKLEDLQPSTSKVPKTLGKALSLPEYNSSPILGPQDTEHQFVTTQTRFSFSDNGVISENIWKIDQENDRNLISSPTQNLETEMNTDEDIKLQVLDLNPEDTSGELLNETINETTSVCKEDVIRRDGEERVETIESMCIKESYLCEGPPESNCSSPTSRSNPDTDTLKDANAGASKIFLDSDLNGQPSLSSLESFSSNAFLVKKVEDRESINNGPEWQSPISVLEPMSLEEDISPPTAVALLGERQIKPVRICFEEHDSSVMVATPKDQEILLSTCTEDKIPTFEYVKAVLQASGLSWDEFMTNYQSSEEILDPSLFEEVEISPSRLCGEPELIFDCINEVLVELYERYFGCPAWLSIVKSNIRPVPIGNSIIKEVWEGINWHLIPQPEPCTLDHIIGRDMAKEGTWLNLQYDMEEIGIEISEAILIDLMQETILNLCS